ncbi:B3 domain-containing protein [Raphanus sativus]|nr:B3 domain-containing protein [Raphanus sativus]
MSRSKPRVVVKATEEENRLPDRVPRQKRSSSRVPRKETGRSFRVDPSSSTALVAYVSEEDNPNGHIHHSPSMASPRIPRLSRKKRPRASSSTALVEYVSQENESPPTMRSLSRKKRPRASSSTALVEYVSQENESPPTMRSLSRKKRPRASSSTALVEYVSQEDESPPTTGRLSRKKRPPPLPPKAKQPKKKKATVGPSSWRSDPTPEWLLKLMKGGEEPKKIIEKVLTATDMNHNHNRLSMPCSHIIDMEFLSLAEQDIIEKDEERKNKIGIKAELVEMEDA